MFNSPARKKLGAIGCVFVLAMAATLPAQAAMVGTDEVLSTAEARQTRQHLLNIIEREAVRERLVAMGVSPEQARERIQRLTTAELARIQGRLDEAPAGGNAVIAVAVIVFTAFVITDAIGVTDIFPFIKPVLRPGGE